MPYKERGLLFMSAHELRKDINILEHIVLYCSNIREIHERFGYNKEKFFEDNCMSRQLHLIYCRLESWREIYLKISERIQEM